jgi:hypothetical protein
MDVKRDPNQQQEQPRWVERRSGVDRRNDDVGPPGKHERRRGVESRKPEVVELDMSDSEWTALSQGAPRPAP